MSFNKTQLRKDTKELNKAKAPKKSRDIIYDPAGQWKFPGQNTRIPGSNITMQGVPYPVLAQPNVGQPQMMYPGQDYVFPGASYVDEQPQMKKGGRPRGLVPMPKPSKKGLASKAYSRSLDATNKLFTENYLFKKPKDKRRKVFDPNAKYYADGGEYGMPLGAGVSQNFIGNRDQFKVGGIPELPLRDNQVNYDAFVNGFEPMSKKQDGGPYNTDGPVAQEEYMEDYPVNSLPKIYGHEPEDYQTFLDYNQTAPENRRGYEEYKYGDPNSYDHYGMWDALGKPKDFQEALQINPDWQPDEYDGMYHGFSVNPNTGVFLKSGKPGLKEGDTTWMEIKDHYLSPRSNTSTPVYDPELQRFKYIPKEEDGGYIELELTPEEIQTYRDGGYIVEDISVPSLNQYDKGGRFKRRKKKQEEQEQLEYRPPVEVNDEMYESVTPFPEAPEEFKQGVGNIKEIEKKAQAPDWLKFSNEYEKKNSKQAFIDEKKKEYLKGTNQGLLKAQGYNMENFPEDVERNFEKAYDYKKNSFIVKKLGKKEKFSPNRRGEWVDELSKKEKEIVANSKYESKLQPSLWDRSLAGLVTLTTPFSAQANDAMNKGELPGLTKKEQREIKDSKMFGIPTGGLESLAGWDALGVAAANAIEQSGNEFYGGSYRQAPGENLFLGVSGLSGQPMANVKPGQVAALNPLNYTLPYDIPMLGASVVRGVGNLGKFVKEMPSALNANLIQNSGRFAKPKYAKLPVNVEASEIARMNQIDEAKGILAYRNPNKSQNIKDFVAKTNLSDDDLVQIFGKTKEEILNLKNNTKPNKPLSNQRPAIPTELLLDPDLAPIANSNQGTIINGRMINNNEDFLDVLEQEGNIYDYLMSNPDTSTLLLNDPATRQRTMEHLAYGSSSEVPTAASSSSRTGSHSDMAIEAMNQEPAYMRRNRDLAQRLSNAAGNATNSGYNRVYNIQDVIDQAIHVPNKKLSTVEEIKEIPQNIRKLFEPTVEKNYVEAVPTLYASSFKNKREMLGAMNARIKEAVDNADIGEVITGSTNTSYNSYLPQVDMIFKNAGKEGLSEPVFLGHHMMNDSGFLSQNLTDNKKILEYVNNNLNKIQKRTGKNLNLGQHKPYIKNNYIYLPQYGLRKISDNVSKIVKKEGGEIILDNISDADLQKYVDAGYIVEELD